MQFNAIDLEKRKPLWAAFSDLWLDTEVSQMTLNYIAREMRESGYSLTEQKCIYQHEVAPVVYQNLLVTVGVWDGFDEEWLHDEIQKNINKPILWKKFWFYINKSKMFYATKEDWARLETLFLKEGPHD